MNYNSESSRDAKGSIRDYVYDKLKADILDLKLEPGRFISEKDIIEMLKVSRTPIREAFVKLSQEGLIETIPQRGSFISLIDLDMVEESRFVRETLESTIVRLACEQLKAEQVLQLLNLIALQELCIEEKTISDCLSSTMSFTKRLSSDVGSSAHGSCFKSLAPITRG